MMIVDFEKLVTYQHDNGEYRIDFEKFHNVYDVDTPSCSTKELDKMRDLGLKPEDAYQITPMNDNSTGNSPIIAIHPKGSSPRLSVLLSKGDNYALNHPDKVETDDEDNDQTIHVDLGLQHKRSLLMHVQSPDILARHKQSVRRGPDLF